MVPISGIVDLEVREQLQQEAFEFIVGAVDLVDQQDRDAAIRLLERPQQRSLDEERFAEESLIAAGRCGIAPVSSRRISSSWRG